MKKYLSVLFSILVFLSTISLSFAEVSEIKIGGYNINNGNMNLNYSITNNSGVTTNPTNTQIKIGDKEYKINDIKTLKNSGLPQTYVFLVDVSGSIGGYKVDIKEIVRSVVKLKNKNDKVMIYTFDNRVIKHMEITNDKNIIDRKISEIDGSGSSTSLYASVEEVVKQISSNDDTNVRKNLVILSDGMEDHAKGKALEEIYSTIEKSGIPIYSVSVADDRETYEINKPFISFANKSAGGIGIFAYEYGSPDAVAEEITNLANSSYVASIDISKFEKKSDTAELSLSISGSNLKEGIKNLSQSQLDGIVQKVSSVEKKDQVQETKKQTGEISTTPGTETQQQTKKGDNNLMFIIAGVAIAIILLIIILILVFKGKSSNAIMLSLIDDSNPQNDRNVKLKDKITIGRDSSNAISYSKDSRLSSRHCEIYIQNGMLFVKDLNSTNGTYVNGIKVAPISKIRNSDILLIGSMELKVRLQ